MKPSQHNHAAHLTPTATDRPLRASAVWCHSSLVTRHSLRFGFTILEMLVATGVLAVMVSILFGLFAQGSGAWRYGERQADIYQSARLALDFVSRDVAAAMIDTTTNYPPLRVNYQGQSIQVTPDPMRGLSVIIRSSPSGGQPPPAEASKHGLYDDLQFVAPTTIGNGMTNNEYRITCGVRYYVAQARKPNGARSELGNLTRVIYRAVNKDTGPFSIYETDWWMGSSPLGTRTNSTVLAENVLTFRVQPMELDPTTLGLKLANPSMFRSLTGDRDFEFGGVRPGLETWQLVSIWPPGYYGNNNRYRLKYPALVIGLCVVDRRTADRINLMGLDDAAKARDFQTTTNWTTAYFECAYR